MLLRHRRGMLLKRRLFHSESGRYLERYGERSTVAMLSRCTGCSTFILQHARVIKFRIAQSGTPSEASVYIIIYSYVSHTFDSGQQLSITRDLNSFRNFSPENLNLAFGNEDGEKYFILTQCSPRYIVSVLIFAAVTIRVYNRDTDIERSILRRAE